MKIRQFLLISVVFLLSINSSKTFAQASGKLPISIFKDGKTTISEIRLTGLDSDEAYYGDETKNYIYEIDIYKFLRENRAGIFANEKFDSRKVEQTIKLLKQHLADLGYWEAEVTALGIKLPDNRMNLIFSVRRNSISRVSEIRFVKNKVFTNEALVGVMKECLDDSWATFDKKHYQYCADKTVRRFMFSKGYLNANIKQISQHFSNGYFVVTIEAEEGIRYRIGEMNIEGATAFSRKELLKMWGQSEGEIADGKLLQDFVYEKLKKAYADKGYILYNAEFDCEFIKPPAEGLDAVVNILITIDERKSFNLAGINFKGVSEEESQKLRESFSLKKGDVFNLSEFEKGIKIINKTEKFIPIDINREIDLKIDEEAGTVFPIIELRQND